MTDVQVLTIYGFLLLLILLVTLWGITVTSRLAKIERTLSRVATHLHVDLVAPLPLSDRVMETARDPSRKIEAIRLYRDETGAGLAEAKQAVEDYTRTLDR